MKFIYLDECKDIEHTNIISLTGVLICSNAYQLLRKGFYEILGNYIQPESGTINLNPPEIHGSDLLPLISDDDEKLRVLREIAELIINVQVRVYRVGYYAKESLISTFGGIDEVLSLCLFGIKVQCQSEYANNMLMPVMDSVNLPVYNAFSRSIKSLDIMRSASISNSSLSLQNTGNLCEMHFADSKHSALIQIADIVSYLLHAHDYERCGLHQTSFKKKIITISKLIAPSVMKNEVIDMNIT